MKNKKSLLGLGLFALVLVLGVGYALVSSQDLSIGGKASVADSTLAVSFNGTTDKSGAGNIAASATEGATEASITVTGLTAVGQEATATYTIQNEETDLDAAITVSGTVENDKGAFFEVTPVINDAVIPAGETGTVTVKVKLKQMPIEEEDSEATIKVNLKGTPVQPSA